MRNSRQRRQAARKAVQRFFIRETAKSIARIKAQIATESPRITKHNWTFHTPGVEMPDVDTPNGTDPK